MRNVGPQWVAAESSSEEDEIPVTSALESADRSDCEASGGHAATPADETGSPGSESGKSRFERRFATRRSREQHGAARHCSANAMSAPGGPDTPMRSWTRFTDFVAELGNSRLWGGIHYRNSIEVGAARPGNNAQAALTAPRAEIPPASISQSLGKKRNACAPIGGGIVTARQHRPPGPHPATRRSAHRAPYPAVRAMACAARSSRHRPFAQP